jgi:long-chain acyl-CoA synthetase
VLDDEGFVHTGDVGHFDDDGFLVITDRKKDIIVTAGGKNVAPQNLENELKAHSIVSQALIVGDRSRTSRR